MPASPGKRILHRLLPRNTTSHLEKLISVLGGSLGVLGTIYLNQLWLGPEAVQFLTTSTGASAVLLFASPQGTFAQPWSLIGGQAVSALAGVLCAKWIDDPLLASAASVGLAIGLMYYLRCLHPPGGATALYAVIGGEGVHALGFGYVLTPILANAALLCLMGVLFNLPFPWRRYPNWLRRQRQATLQSGRAGEMPGLRDLRRGMAAMDSYVDISEQDLERIYTLAVQQAERKQLKAAQLATGRYYSNGRYGPRWAVRQIVDEQRDSRPQKDRVIYKVVAGEGLYSTGICTRTEFARWGRYEVQPKDGSWHRVRKGTRRPA